MSSAYRYQSPPNWPPPPDGWTPPDGWKPPSDWPVPPEGWQFWVPVGAAPPASDPGTSDRSPETPAAAQPESGDRRGAEKIPLFGARRRARELASSVDALTLENARLTTAKDSLAVELERVGAMDTIRIEEERDAARRAFDEEKEVFERRRREARDSARAELDELAGQRDDLVGRIAELERQVVHLEEEAILQEVGIYEYQHPLQDAEAYKERLAKLRSRIKQMAKADGGAVLATNSWTVNGSAAQGRRMVSQTSKLMLRAYNAEADALVKGLKPHRLAASIERLWKTAATIERLGTTMSIEISHRYQAARIDELKLTADYLTKVEEEKEATRAAKAALREQRKVEQEMARQREKLEKERDHYANALAALQGKGDVEGAARIQEQMADVDRAIEDVDYRAANQRAGYVYVISNLGAFGDGMIKVGLTRRLEPMDRIRELSDASVPFNFDIHTLFFSEDAVGIEAELHRRLADRRVNRVNLRREYFYATPHEVLEQLRDLAGEVLTFAEEPEALEYRQSRSIRGADGRSPEPES